MGPDAAMMQASQQSGSLGKWYGLSMGVSALSQLAGGFSQMQAAGQESRLMQAQADLAYSEARRDAAQKAREVTSFQQRQAHRYASSGITLQGTPIEVMEQTRRLGQEEVDAMLKRGEAERSLMMAKARRTRTAGRNAFFGSATSALLGGVNSYITGRRYGVFGTTTQGTYNVPDMPVGPMYSSEYNTLYGR